MTGLELNFPEPVNALHKACLVAAVNSLLLSAMEPELVVSDDERTMPWLENVGTSVDLGDLPLIKRLQIEAVQKTVEHYCEPLWETVYIDELSWVATGFDAVFRNRATNRFVICEAKGTTRRIKGPLSYLKKTRHKGRQLSWEWIVNSALELANLGSSAKVFFPILAALVEERTDRVLLVSRFDNDEGVLRYAETGRFVESDFDKASLSDKRVVSVLQEMTTEMTLKSGHGLDEDAMLASIALANPNLMPV